MLRGKFLPLNRHIHSQKVKSIKYAVLEIWNGMKHVEGKKVNNLSVKHTITSITLKVKHGYSKHEVMKVK